MHNRTIGVALAVACTLALAGCSSDDKPKGAPQPQPQGQAPFDTAPVAPPAAQTSQPPKAPSGKVGDTLTLVDNAGGPLDYTLVQIVETKATNTVTAAKPGNRLIAIQWKITNNGAAPVTQNPSGAHVIDAAGQQYGEHFGEVQATPEFPSATQIAPGASRVGYRSYELPADAKVTEVQLQTGGALTAVTGSWKP